MIKRVAAQITAALHFNQFQRQLSRIGQSMHIPQRNGGGFDADAVQLLGQHKAVILIAHHDGRSQVLHAQGGFLQQGVLATGQPVKLLGVVLA